VARRRAYGVGDTSVLQALHEIGALELLHRSYGTVHVPAAVRDELTPWLRSSGASSSSTFTSATT